MDYDTKDEPQAGDTVANTYEVLVPRGFAGVLHTARIMPGHPNAGVPVILTRKKLQPAGPRRWL